MKKQFLALLLTISIASTVNADLSTFIYGTRTDSWGKTAKVTAIATGICACVSTLAAAMVSAEALFTKNPEKKKLIKKLTLEWWPKTLAFNKEYRNKIIDELKGKNPRLVLETGAIWLGGIFAAATFLLYSFSRFTPKILSGEGKAKKEFDLAKKAYLERPDKNDEKLAAKILERYDKAKCALEKAYYDAGINVEIEYLEETREEEDEVEGEENEGEGEEKREEEVKLQDKPRTESEDDEQDDEDDEPLPIATPEEIARLASKEQDETKKTDSIKKAAVKIPGCKKDEYGNDIIPSNFKFKDAEQAEAFVKHNGYHVDKNVLAALKPFIKDSGYVRFCYGDLEQYLIRYNEIARPAVYDCLPGLEQDKDGIVFVPQGQIFTLVKEIETLMKLEERKKLRIDQNLVDAVNEYVRHSGAASIPEIECRMAPVRRFAEKLNSNWEKNKK